MTALVQNAGFGTWAASSPATKSFASTPAVGNAVIVAVFIVDNYNPGSVTSVTDNQGGSNTYSFITGVDDITGGNNCRTELWWCSSLAAASGTFTLSAAYSGAPYGVSIVPMELTGITGVDQTGTFNATDTSGTVTASGQNTNANDFVVALMELGSYNGSPNISSPATSGYTSGGSGTGPQYSGVAQEISYKDVTGVETSAASWSWTGVTSTTAAIIVSFKTGAAGGAFSPGMVAQIQRSVVN